VLGFAARFGLLRCSGSAYAFCRLFSFAAPEELFSWLEKKTKERGEREKGSSDWEHHLEDLGFLFFWFLHVFTSREVGRPFLMTFFSSSFSCCFFLA